MSDFKRISNTIWNVADLLRGSWKAHEYQDVILPFSVLKRLDSALESTKDKVLSRFNDLDGKVDDLSILKRVSSYGFYNTSPFTIKKLLDSPSQIDRNMRNYLDGFSDNVKDIFKKFKFDTQLDRLKGGDLLYLVLKEFDRIDLHPDRVPNDVIGSAFEDLIRRFAEQSNETAGEHYTPRDVVKLMTALIFCGEEEELKKRGVVRTLYDPACGTGGMLTVGKEYIQENINKDATIYLFGQELNGTTYAICKADMLLKGEDPERIKGGDEEHSKASTLSNDVYSSHKFDYIISNPPYGVDWKKDKKAVEKEYARGKSGRFYPGLPRISDGQFLFLEHIISKFKTKDEGGSDAVVITNGSPLFTGDAGQGESNIRRWLIENDYIDTIIALPDQLFFNTGIPTYIWVFTNRKPKTREDKIQLIDARHQKTQRRKNLGSKRYDISEDSFKEIINSYKDYKDAKHVKIFDSSIFGYRAVTIQRPLRLKSQFTKEKINELRFGTNQNEKNIMKELYDEYGEEIYNKDDDFWKEQKKEKLLYNKAKPKDERIKDTIIKKATNLDNWKESRALVLAGLKLCKVFNDQVFTNYNQFEEKVKEAIKENKIELLKNGDEVSINASNLKRICRTVSERDPEAEKVIKKKTEKVIEYEADTELKDIERIPLNEDIETYFKREVLPYAEDAWIDESVTDEQDKRIGKVGYEIPFTRYFYKYQPPREPEIIQEDISIIEKEINELMKDF